MQPEPVQATIARREALQQLAGSLAALPALAALFGAGVSSPAQGGTMVRLPLVLSLGNLLIPADTTPGAGTADVAEFVLRVLAAGALGVSGTTLDRLSGELDRRSGSSFEQLPEARQ